jgi:membrane protein DedA with SNARE-associated domain
VADDAPTTDAAAPADRRYPVPVRRTVLGLAIARYVIPIASLALLPAGFREDVSARFLYLLIALRPGREVMLLLGYRVRVTDEPSVLGMFVAAFPLFVAAVWVFFLLGRVYRTSLREGTGPAWLQRMAPPDRLEIAQRALVRRGPIVAFLGRVGGLPPTLLAAAAGVSDVRPTRYLIADAVGSVATFAITVAIGYGLGEAYERSGPWFTGFAVVVVIALSTWFSSWMQRELDREGAPDAAS